MENPDFEIIDLSEKHFKKTDKIKIPKNDIEIKLSIIRSTIKQMDENQLDYLIKVIRDTMT